MQSRSLDVNALTKYQKDKKDLSKSQHDTQSSNDAAASKGSELATLGVLRQANRLAGEHVKYLKWKTGVQVELLTLSQTMDPLVASYTYNDKHSPLYILPEEVFLHILRKIVEGEDKASFSASAKFLVAFGA
ncbi:hypothetical protein ACJZ2D_000892 [Fusarium nematophilum]